MKPEATCPECRAVLPADAPHGLCPACLARLGQNLLLEETTAADQAELLLSSGAIPQGFGDYEFLEEIAHGGMGVVYKARQKSLNRFVAVKMIVAGPFASRTSVQRFQAEAQLAARLQHPNIVAIHEIGEYEGHNFFSMDYVDGPNLGHLVRDGPLPARRAAAYVRTIAEAIHYAHKQGVLHRDLKPANILIDSNDQPRVTDFGLAKQLSGDTDLTVSGQVLGSPSFMPPEQAGGRRSEIGPASDVYSLGAVLYHLLTGRPPFVAASVETTIAMVMNTEVVAPKLLNPGLPRDLDTICLKCLEKEPGRRYQSARELAEELGRVLMDEPIVARPVTPLERGWRWCRRRPVIAGLAAGIVLALLAGFAGVTWQWRRAEVNRGKAENAVTALEIERAELLFGSDRSRDALPYLARILRRDPSNHVAAERLVSALTHRDFCLPALPPLQHQGRVTSAEFSADGEKILTSSEDGSARLWNSRTGQQILALAHSNGVLLARFSPDSGRILTLSREKAWIWDEQGRPVAGPLIHGATVMDGAFSPDGARIVTICSDGIARIWQVETGQPDGPELRHEPSTGLRSATFSPDGTKILIVAGRATRLWDSRNGQPLTPLLRDTAALHFAKFSPDSRKIASGGDVGLLRFRHASNGEPLFHGSDSSPLLAGAFSPDGHYFAWGSENGKVQVLSGGNAQTMATIQHDAAVLDLCFSADSQWVLTASRDNTARIWDVLTGEAITEPVSHHSAVRIARMDLAMERLLTAPEGNAVWVWRIRDGASRPAALASNVAIRNASFSPSGNLILALPTLPDRSPQIWNAKTGKLHRSLRVTSAVRDAFFSPDDKHFLTLEGPEARLRAIDSGDVAQIFKHSGPVFSAQFERTGQMLITASGSTLKFWETKTGVQLHQLDLPEPINNVLLSPDGQFALIHSTSNQVRLWRTTESEKPWLNLRQSRAVTSMAISPDNRLVAVGTEDRTTVVFDRSSGAAAHSMVQDEVPTMLEFSPEGGKLAVSFGNSAQIWDTASGQSITAPLKHLGLVTSVDFSPDGKRLATASHDKTIRIWDAATGHPVSESLHHPSVVYAAMFSPCGKWVCGASSVLCLWQLPPDSTPAPSWIPSLAEAIATRRLNLANEAQTLGSSELILQQNLALSGDFEDPYRRWASWFFVTSDQRPVSYDSAICLSNSPGLLLERAGRFLFAGDYRQALELTRKSIDQESSGIWSWSWYYLAVLHLKIGDVDGYKKCCAEMLARYGASDAIRSDYFATEAIPIAMSCLMSPLDEPQLRSISNILGGASVESHMFKESAQGLLDYRLGRYQEALSTMKKIAAEATLTTRDTMAWVVLAMAQWQTGQKGEAAISLQKGRDRIGSRPFQPARPVLTSAEWYAFLTTVNNQVLMDEAALLIEGKADRK